MARLDTGRIVIPDGGFCIKSLCASPVYLKAVGKGKWLNLKSGRGSCCYGTDCNLLGVFMADQKELRQQILAARNRLSIDEIAAKSLAITELLFGMETFRDCRLVMFYAAFRSEVQTGKAISRCLEQGLRLALPMALPASRGLQPRLVNDPSLDLRPGYCGIAEPDPDRTGLIDPVALEVVVVPGSVFDLRGGRLGYGGGFYDRFLAMEAPQAKRIGLAFAMQVVAGELPLADHDQRLDYLVTEEHLYSFPRTPLM